MSDTEEIGPALPPHLLKRKSEPPDCRTSPQVNVIGPTLPPGCSRNTQSSGSSDSDSSSSDSESEQKISRTIGPVMPRGHQMLVKEQHSPELLIGPALPPGLKKSISHNDSDSDEDNMFGPRPPVPGQERVVTAADELEERARKMKHRLIHGADEDSRPQRDSWMTELPAAGSISKHMGLKARKLGDGSKVKDEDQSVWTDKPEDKQRKAQEEFEGGGVKRKHCEPVQSSRDKYMAEQVEEYNKKKRQDTLLDLHTKKLSKKKKKEEKKKKKKEKKMKKKGEKIDAEPHRRAFDRDTDLSVNKFDNAQRKSLIKRSQELNTKFGRGGQQFL